MIISKKKQSLFLFFRKENVQVIYIDDLEKDIIIKSKVDLTIGFFDGVHLGHQFLLDEMIEISDNEKMVITFSQHPTKRKILDDESKMEHLEKKGIDYVLVLELNESNRHLKADEFEKFLNKININKIVVGKDFNYGYHAQGDVNTLSQKFDVHIIEFLCNEKNKYSSRDIRTALDNGDLEEVNKILGKPYSLYGVVVKGDQIGRTIDFPTANMECGCYLPKQGVYITNVKINGKIYPSITNIGNRPTISGSTLRNETHILDFNQNIYGDKIKIIFIKVLREEIKFDSLEKLQEQIRKDVKKRREYDNQKVS